MTLHIIKLCVGVGFARRPGATGRSSASPSEEEETQPLVLQHVTRMTPKRADEVLDGGSLYWVIKGQIAVRQKLRRRSSRCRRNGKPHCALVYEPKLIPVHAPRPSPVPGLALSRSQGCAAGRARHQGGNLPEKLKLELAELGLL